jgi:hypothetical protein
MPRKYDAHKDELEGVAQRLRDERPEASPLELDRIKTTAMARAKAGTRRGGAGARRLAVASLTVGLLAAGTGGVLAGETHGKSGGNAANAQYGGECNVSVGNGNTGSNDGNDNEIYNCNENSFNTTEINEYNSSTTYNTFNATTITVPAAVTPAAGGVLGSTTKKATTSSKRVNIHINVPRRSKLRKVTLKVNGKVVSILKGKAAKANVSIANLPCSATVTITAVTNSGKSVTQTHVYKLC